MATITAPELLRPGLLKGVTVLVAGGQPVPDGPRDLAAAVRAACAEMGAVASLWRWPPDGAHGGEDAGLERALSRALVGEPGVGLLVVDSAGLFAGAAGASAREALRACLDASWSITRAVVKLAFLAQERGGRIVFLAPASGAGEHGQAARAGVENLARTLSIEWARHHITTLTIVPGVSTTPDEVGAVSAYLASPAGAYFSGCVLDLGGPLA